jgi:hypothetical protein
MPCNLQANATFCLHDAAVLRELTVPAVRGCNLQPEGSAVLRWRLARGGIALANSMVEQAEP